MKDYRKDLLDWADKGISKSKGVLTRLFRTILYAERISGPRWEMCMNRLLDDPRNPTPKNCKDRSSLKGNLNKALKGDRMTWKTFEKALRFLGCVRIRFEVHCTWANGKTVVYGVNQEIGSFSDEDYQVEQDHDDMAEIVNVPTVKEMEKMRRDIERAVGATSEAEMDQAISRARRSLEQISKRPS